MQEIEIMKIIGPFIGVVVMYFVFSWMVNDQKEFEKRTKQKMISK